MLGNTEDLSEGELRLFRLSLLSEPYKDLEFKFLLYIGTYGSFHYVIYG
jgi:hypothetical protein